MKHPLTRQVLLPLLLPLLLLLAGATASAGEGHDHGEAPAGVNANGPQRLPDGSVFLPKPAQRQIGLRTLVGVQQALPRALELNGRVLMDPNAGGRVQAMQAGRLEAGPRGLPQAGQSVRKGELLAYVLPATGGLERAGQRAQLAELRAAAALAAQRLARLRELADTVPRKDIEALESEGASLAERARALDEGLSGREALRAPVSGVIASANAVAGQVVDARELLFEVVDPSRLRIEALAYEPDLAQDIAAAYVPLARGRQLGLSLIGAARSLREQALPISFKAQGPELAELALGQPVRVIVQTRTRLQGVAVPAAAVLRNPANQRIVWVKTAAERFEPRVVTAQVLDGASLVVSEGLKAGERVVSDGAGLLNQIR